MTVRTNFSMCANRFGFFYCCVRSVCSVYFVFPVGWPVARHLGNIHRRRRLCRLDQCAFVDARMNLCAYVDVYYSVSFVLDPIDPVVVDHRLRN